jgi:hypothetical protein
LYLRNGSLKLLTVLQESANNKLSMAGEKVFEFWVVVTYLQPGSLGSVVTTFKLDFLC